MSKVHLSIKTIFGRPKGGRIRQVSLYLYGIGYIYTQQIDDGISIFWGTKFLLFLYIIIFSFKLVYIVMLFALGTIWQSSFFKHNYM